MTTTDGVASGAVWFLRYFIVIQLATGTVGLFVVDPDGKGDSVETGTGAESTTSTTTGGKATTTTTTGKSKDGAAPATTAAAPATTATTAAPKATTTSTTRPAGPVLKPAAAGKYDYRVTSTDSDGENDTGTGSYTLSAAREVDGEIRQTEVDTTEGTTTTTSYAWRSDGFYVRSVEEDGSGCNFEPDIMVIASPPTVGRQWRVDTSCTSDGETVTVTGTSRIARTERITVAGRQLDVHVVESTARFEDFEFRGAQYISVERGLIVRDDTTYDDGSREVIELLNVDPK